MKELGGSGAVESENDTECTFVRFRKSNPPTYDGKSDPLLAERWIRKIEKIFRVERAPNNRNINFATQFLEGKAEY